MKKRKTIYSITMCGVMTALLCIIAPLTIMLPGGVPITLANMILYLTVYLLGGMYATACCGIYLLLGIVGLPVFSNYGSGIAKVVGPTGGYLLGYLFVTVIMGGIMHLGKRKLWSAILGMVLGLAVLYAFGTIWFMISCKATLKYTLSVCVYPFLALDAAKIAVVAIVGPLVKKPITRFLTHE